MATNPDKIIYVSREIERALGQIPGSGYRIISNQTAYGESVKKEYPDFVTLIADQPGKLLGTTDLLNHPETAKTISQTDRLLVFKNTVRVESAAKAHGWKIVNPSAELSERIENKLSQLRWLGPLGIRYLPPHAAKIAKFITWKSDSPFIIQWAHGHTGDGTLIIKTADDLRLVQEKFPERMARVSSFIEGPSFTVNAVVTPERIILGNISYQITGLQPFTDNEFSTIGNDWGLAKKILTNEDLLAIRAMTEEIGDKMRSDGWRGLFGIDFIKDANSKRIYLIEINARQPASTTLESSLQEEVRLSENIKGLTTFEAHLRALLGQPIDQDLIQIQDGAQIVQRLTRNIQSVFDDVSSGLVKKGYRVIAYQNTDPNSDLLRVQSTASIMESHLQLNPNGKEIVEAIKNSHFKIKI